MDDNQGLLKRAWRAVQREGAEKILSPTIPGTYLFRKDHFASCLEEILSGAKKASIQCYTLAYLDGERQIREKTVVHWGSRWLFYDDDPSLDESSFTSLEALLASLGSFKPIEPLA